MEDFTFSCDLNNTGLSESDIYNMLPSWKTNILEIYMHEGTERKPEIRFLISALNEDEIKAWISEYEEKSQCSYSVRSTEKCMGRYVIFKQRLNCQRNTRTKPTSGNPIVKKTKNTNCPSFMRITLKAVKKRYQGKNKNNAPKSEMPCEVILIPTHNHEAFGTSHAQKEIREKLLKLFESGHTAATALESIKMDIQMKYKNYKEIISNQNFCPNYNYCYHLYQSEYIKKLKEISCDVQAERNFLKECVEKYNRQCKDDCAHIMFHKSHYVICICSPLMKRSHERIIAASDLVLMDSSKIDNNARIYTLLTYSECGGVPLGIIMTSVESVEVLTIGLEVLREMVGDSIFGGLSDGPKIFLTSDSTIDQSAISSVWCKTTCFLCSYHVLQDVWKRIVESKDINDQDHQMLFQQFKAILYEEDCTVCCEKYEIAKDAAKKYPNYCKVLEDYWKRKEMWILSVRNDFLTQHGWNEDNYSEASMRLLTYKIFEHTKSFNFPRMLNFLLFKFSSYYEKNLLDAAYNRQRRKFFTKNSSIPPQNVVDRVQILDNNVHLIPSDVTGNFYYIVDVNVLMCTCFDGQIGHFCKHIDWVYYLMNATGSVKTIENVDVRRNFYYVVNGRDPPSLWPKRLRASSSENEHCVIDEEGVDASHQDGILLNYGKHNDEKNIEVQETIYEDAQTLGENLIEQIANHMLIFLQDSPKEMLSSLEILHEKFTSLKSVPEFLAACGTFASDSDGNIKTKSK